MKLSRNLVGGLVVLVFASSVVVNGLPAPSTRKNSRRQMESTSAVVAPAEEVTAAVVSTTVPTTQDKVSETEVGSVAPVGDLVENTKAPSTPLHPFIEGEVQALTSPIPAVLSTAAPAPPPDVSGSGGGQVLPGLEGQRPVYAAQRPGGPGQGPEPTNAPPPAPPTTKKPDEEDDSSSEEDNDEAGDSETETQNEEDDDNEDEDEDEDDEAARSARKDNELAGIVVDAAPVKKEKENQKQEKVVVDQPNADATGIPQPEALIPGYISETGEIFVPIDTLEKVTPYSYSIIPDNSVQRGRLGYSFYRSDVGDDYDFEVEDEEDDDSTAADATTSEEAEDDTSSAEDDGDSDEEPIRVSSFKVLYKQKPKEQEAETEEESEEKEVEEKPDEVEARPVKTSPPSSSEEKNPALLTNQQPQFRPRPPLASIPATRPTNEDDENELRNRYLRRIPSFGISNLMSPYPHYYSSYVDPRRPYYSYDPPQLNAGGYYH